jgi:catechol 2,3-dioxygenase-like lactoylglutathione lyase family enzyme
MTEKTTEKSATRISGVRTVAVTVGDQDRALAFYTGKLGFEVRLDESFGAGQRWIEVAPAGAVTSLALVLADAGAALGVDTGIRLSTADAAADHATLQALGVEVDAELIRWPGVPPMFALRDPDGNRLVIVEIA